MIPNLLFLRRCPNSYTIYRKSIRTSFSLHVSYYLITLEAFRASTRMLERIVGNKKRWSTGGQVFLAVEISPFLRVLNRIINNKHVYSGKRVKWFQSLFSAAHSPWHEFTHFAHCIHFSPGRVSREYKPTQ